MSPIEAKPKAREAAERALQLDPQLGEAHSVLANVSFSYDWDFEAAEREFQRAFALSPNDATAHLWYGHYSMMRNHLPVAMQENSRTFDLDPNPRYSTQFARRSTTTRINTILPSTKQATQSSGTRPTG
jgi:Tfp pilus assembly protein PilF